VRAPSGRPLYGAQYSRLLKAPRYEILALVFVRQPGFLLDRDSAHLKAVLGGKTVQDVGLLPKHLDEEVIQKAWERGLIIVTANQDDFIRKIYRFQQKQQESDCHDLFGLVVVPNKNFDAQRVLGPLKRGIRIEGKDLSRRDIHDQNLFVHVERSGRVDVKRFPMCFYCKKLKVRDVPEWLERLQVVGLPKPKVTQ